MTSYHPSNMQHHPSIKLPAETEGDGKIVAHKFDAKIDLWTTIGSGRSLGLRTQINPRLRPHPVFQCPSPAALPSTSHCSSRLSPSRWRLRKNPFPGISIHFSFLLNKICESVSRGTTFFHKCFVAIRISGGRG